MKYVWSRKQNKHKMNGGVNLHTYSIEAMRETIPVSMWLPAKAYDIKSRLTLKYCLHCESTVTEYGASEMEYKLFVRNIHRWYSNESTPFFQSSMKNT